MTALQRQSYRRANPLKTGDLAADRVTGGLLAGQAGDDSDTLISDLLAQQAKTFGMFKIERAFESAIKNRGRLDPDTLEGTISATLAKMSSNPTRGFKIPWQSRVAQVQRRALDTVTGAGSVTSVIPDRYMIDILRNKLVCQQLGAQVLNLIGDGPHGNVQLPQKLTTASVSWVAESTAPVSSNMTVGAKYLRPKTVSAFTDITFREMNLAQPGFVSLVINDLMTAIAHEVDRACLNGLGTPGNILGILQGNGGILTYPLATTGVNGGTIAYVDLVGMEQAVGDASGDAGDVSLAWCTSPGGRSKLRRTDLGGATPTGRYVWTPKQQMLGWPAAATRSVPSDSTMGTGTALTSLVFGDWNSMVVNVWGDGIDILIDFTKFSSNGVLRITAFCDADMTVRQQGSFVAAAGFATV